MEAHEMEKEMRPTGRRVCLIGMSGVGKTHLAELLRSNGRSYHYGVAYRIGSHNSRRELDADLPRERKGLCRFRTLLRADSITVRAKLGLNNLDAMSDYLGKIGSAGQGGLPREEFLRRQKVHMEAERAATLDYQVFLGHAQRVLDYSDFVCDCSGSLCSVVDPWDAQDPIMSSLARDMLVVYIEGDTTSRQVLVDRFRARPKPIYYSEPFFLDAEKDYLAGRSWDDVDPNDFATWAFARIVDYRLPRYREIARRWGITISSSDVMRVRNAEDFWSLVDQTRAFRAA